MGYDMSADDMLSSADLDQSLKFQEMQAFLEYVGVDNTEVMQLHKVLAHRHAGSVSIEDFVKGCFRVGRPAKSIDSMRLSDQLLEMQVVIESLTGIHRGYHDDAHSSTDPILGHSATMPTTVV